jgi:hypothetical protein
VGQEAAALTGGERRSAVQSQPLDRQRLHRRPTPPPRAGARRGARAVAADRRPGPWRRPPSGARDRGPRGHRVRRRLLLPPARRAGRAGAGVHRALLPTRRRLRGAGGGRGRGAAGGRVLLPGGLRQAAGGDGRTPGAAGGDGGGRRRPRRRLAAARRRSAPAGHLEGVCRPGGRRPRHPRPRPLWRPGLVRRRLRPCRGDGRRGGDRRARGGRPPGARRRRLPGGDQVEDGAPTPTRASPARSRTAR